MNSRKAFTLIELLVVIAIIAILAAILFPVFAQAREKARSIACLSNSKQIGLAYIMYNQDYDEQTPSYVKYTIPGGLDGVSGYKNNWDTLIQPYLKNWNVLLCPDSSTLFAEPPTSGVAFTKHSAGWNDPYGCEDNINPTGQCLGYGYNDGWISDQGYGLLSEQVVISGSPTLRLGINIAKIYSPGQMVAFGDTTDGGSYSIAADNSGSGLPLGPNVGGTFSTTALRHGQLWNYTFVDGHAHSIKMVSANTTFSWKHTTASLVIPANINNAYDWCANPLPTYNVVPLQGVIGTNTYPVYTSYPLTAVENCYNAVNDVYQHTKVNP